MDNQFPRLWDIPGIVVVYCAIAAGFATYSLLFPVIPLAVIQAGGSEILAGASTALFMAVTVLTQLATSALLQRYGYLQVMIASALLLGLPGLWHMVSMADISVLFVAMIRGMGFGILCVAQFALIGRVVDQRILGRATGMVGVFVGGAQMVSFPLGLAMLNSRFGLNSVLLLAAILALVTVALSLKMPTVSMLEEPQSGETIIFSWRRIVVLTVVPALSLMCVSMGYGAVSNFLPASVREAGLSTLAGIVLSIIGGAQMVARYQAGRIADTKGSGSLMLPGLGIVALGLGLMMLVVSYAQPMWLLIVAALFFGIGFGWVQNEALVDMFLRTPRSQVDKASTIWNVAFDAGTGVGSFVLGVVASAAGYGAIFVSAMAIVSCALVMQLINIQRR
ncbi:Major facilitator superfamily protein [Corynebacterium kutscheri]|uniref:Arabinose efflux permease family protein n=1 Tax=Corynebacterium kutscheri TaxID=35755 RepID=A0A0F6R2A6_9CORY|nr:MFS transporter [Corynebacterium kutscheri]AKE41518.1 arabinose efflux permease family protein [Corynebacterium kutscheri]VEH08796.1 Major facilitator superfamily protein [Corynebacterium kutscheri]VEH09842.1 Major facilitator superfamily protein [Corynebacterium kutscheri]VEH79925.1 Major facilitator superfamily protein [Corynebacterium kutscheri]